MGAAVQGMDALLRDEVGVMSLQEHAALINAGRK